jgi:cobalamin biosynthesis protein CbiD
LSCSAAAAADSAAPFNCEKLRKVEIVCPKGDKTVGLLVTILLTKLMSPPEISIKTFSGVSW